MRFLKMDQATLLIPECHASAPNAGPASRLRSQTPQAGVRPPQDPEKDGDRPLSQSRGRRSSADQDPRLWADRRQLAQGLNLGNVTLK